MSEPRTLGPWLRRFLAEHIVTERNLARNTQKSYRDTFALLLAFIGARTRNGRRQLFFPSTTIGIAVFGRPERRVEDLEFSCCG